MCVVMYRILVCVVQNYKVSGAHTFSERCTGLGWMWTGLLCTIQNTTVYGEKREQSFIFKTDISETSVNQAEFTVKRLLDIYTANLEFIPHIIILSIMGYGSPYICIGRLVRLFVMDSRLNKIIYAACGIQAKCIWI